MLFVDQPIGTGLSYARSKEEIPTNMDDLGKHFYNAMTQVFFENSGCIKQLSLQNVPLFIIGESYAGKYVPGIAEKILKMNAESRTPKFNLKGIAMGDGFTDPGKIM